MTLPSQLIVCLADGALQGPPFFRVATWQNTMIDGQYTEFNDYSKVWEINSRDNPDSHSSYDCKAYLKCGNYSDVILYANNPWIGWPYIEIGFSSYNHYDFKSLQTVEVKQDLNPPSHPFIWVCTRYPDDWDYLVNGKPLPDSVPRLEAKHFVFQFKQRLPMN